tara:strand:+ start:389 stop:748 length:360 start_codon:yes stop_codon:yes gene_type:complete
MSSTEFDRSEYPELLQLLHDEMSKSDNKLDCVKNFIKTHYPNGLDVGLKKVENENSMFFPNGVYIGYDLCRYLYDDQTAAYLHAIRDALSGVKYYHYGFERTPYVDETSKEYFEVWSNV